MKIFLLLISIFFQSCATLSYDPCAEKYPHNKLDQEVCKERRQKDIDKDRMNEVHNILQFNGGWTF